MGLNISDENVALLFINVLLDLAESVLLWWSDLWFGQLIGGLCFFLLLLRKPLLDCRS